MKLDKLGFGPMEPEGDLRKVCNELLEGAQRTILRHQEDLEKCKEKLRHLLKVATAKGNHSCSIRYETMSLEAFLRDLDKGPPPDGFESWYDYHRKKTMDSWPQWKKDVANQMFGKVC